MSSSAELMAWMAVATTVLRSLVLLGVVALLGALTMRARRGPAPARAAAPWLGAAAALVGLKLLEGLLLWPAVSLVSSMVGMDYLVWGQAGANVLALLSTVALWSALGGALWRLTSDGAETPEEPW